MTNREKKDGTMNIKYICNDIHIQKERSEGKEKKVLEKIKAQNFLKLWISIISQNPRYDEHIRDKLLKDKGKKKNHESNMKNK